MSARPCQCSFCNAINSEFNPTCRVCGKDLPLASLITQRHGDASPGVSKPLQGLLPEGANLPWLFGRYRLLERKTHVGEAELFRAMDTRIRRQVAIKAFPGVRNAGSAAQTAFLKEGRALARLNHPHIAQIYDCLEMGGVPCLVMEWVTGVPLTKIPIEAEPARLKTIVRAVFSALEEIHRCGLIHRDLKPDHILVGNHADVKLIDFGLVKRFGTALDSLSSTPLEEAWRGTPAYMAPEQISGDTIDWRADQFSLAIVLAEWLFGKHPFEGANPAVFLHRIVYAEPGFAPEGRQGVNPRMQTVLGRGLAKAPAQRWPSLAEFRHQLLECWC